MTDDRDLNKPLSQPEPIGLGFATGGIAAASIGLILVLFALLTSGYLAFASVLAAIPIFILARRLDWAGEWGFKRIWGVGFVALLAHLVVTWGLDLLFGTYVSFFGMYAALTYPVCRPLCMTGSDFSPLLNSPAAYYQFATGDTFWGWTKYALVQIPGVIVGAGFLFNRMQDNWEHRGGLLRLLLVIVITFAVALFVAFPKTIDAFLWARDWVNSK